MTPRPDLPHDDGSLVRSLQMEADMEYARAEAERMSKHHNFLWRGRNSVAKRHKTNTSKTKTPKLGGISLTKWLVGQDAGRNNDTNTEFVRDNTPNPTRRLVPSQLTNPDPSAVLNDGSNASRENKSLLYVPCEINDRAVEMMVDTGAATSVISASAMLKLGLDEKLDTRKQGVAAGVGSAPIIGHIEDCPVKIEHAEFCLYFAVLDTETDLFILGIDQLRRFNCLVDLQHNQLVFGGTNGVGVEFFSSYGS